ncbi:MAG: peptide ABC transporter permease [Deltaproteobacteria bacterium RBG_16_49_23]|nr:MAG: peptide ABC transporter permease [Deltaproteobacteria bacterium RBG_16_49_23]
MLRLIPGDPAHLLVGELASPQDIARIREKLGLDSSYVYQYFIYASNLLKGDMGTSIRSNVPVSQEIFVRFLATVELSIAAMLISSLIGILAGVISSVRQYSIFDYFSMMMALVGISMPIFWLGLMLMYLFSVKWGILPMMGRFTMGLDYHVISGLVMLDSLLSGDIQLFFNSVKHLILPAFTLATIPMAIIARMTRSSMLEVMSKDYIRTARAKGLSRGTVIFRHALKNAFLPIITVIGLNFGLLLGGAVLTETIFSWPGLGRYVVDSLSARDYPAVQGCILFFAVIMVIVNLTVDIFYLYLDPRLRIDGKG